MKFSILLAVLPVALATPVALAAPAPATPSTESSGSAVCWAEYVSQLYVTT